MDQQVELLLAQALHERSTDVEVDPTAAPGLRERLVALHAVTIHDISNRWDSAADFSRDVGIHQVAAGDLWKVCDTLVEHQVQMRAKQLKLSSHSLPSRVDADPCQTPVRKRPQPRPHVPTAHDLVVPISHSEPSASSQPSLKSSKKVSMLDTMWQWVKEAGQSSSISAEISKMTQADQLLYFRSWSQPLHKMEPRYLGQKLGIFKSWMTWARGRNYNPYDPSPLQMAEYMEMLSKRAATTAVGSAAQLNWMATKLGIQLHIVHPIVQAWIHIPEGYQPSPQYPFKIKVLAHYDHLAKSDNQVLGHFADSVLLQVNGTLRYAHMQRSTLIDCTPHVILGNCPKGKSKRQDSSAYYWVSPVATVATEDWGRHAWDRKKAIEAELSVEATPYFLHAVGPTSSDVTSATHFKDEPMSYTDYMSSLHRTLQLPPLCMEQSLACKAGSYRARRVLPTSAGTLRLEADESDSIGNWLEHTGGSRQSSRIRAMATRYNENKLRLAAVSKLMCVKALQYATKKAQSFDLEWDSVQFPEAHDLRRACAYAGDGLHRPEVKADIVHDQQNFPLRPKPIGDPLHQSKAESSTKPLLLETTQPEATDSSSSSSSSSDSELHAEEAEETESVLATCSQLQWVVPAHTRARIHVVESTEEEAIVTVPPCNRRLKVGSETGRGLLSVGARMNQWCPQCWQALPAEARSYLHEEGR